MGFPRVYRKSGESATISYDFYDLAEGTGIKKIYGYATTTVSGITYKLGTNIVYADTIETKSSKITNDAGSGYQTVLDLDFDLSSFNLPRTIKGTATINLCVNFEPLTNIAGAYIYAKIRKWDGSSETEIASAQSGLEAPGASDQEHIYCLPIIVPKTHFKKGETLRLSIIATGIALTSGNGGYITLGHDPQNRDGTEINPSTDDPTSTTRLEFLCPFDIDQ